jgi:rubrerythrin
VLGTESWMKKAVGMQVVTEGLALFSFRDMRNSTEEPLLKKLLTYVSRDEARHTGYGIKYLNAVVPTLSGEEKAELEDFAFESARLLVDSRAGVSMRQNFLQLWAEAGVDPDEVLAALAKERERIRAALAKTGGRFGPIRGFVIPTLRDIGLFSERVEGHFKEMFSANFGEAMADFSRDPEHVPEDLEAWVNAGYEDL